MELHNNTTLNKKTQTKSSNIQKPEYQIRLILNEIRAAIEARDLDKLMMFYAPDVVAFDIVPPLQIIGKDEYKKSWQQGFESYQDDPDKKNEVHGLSITASESVAFVHSLCHNFVILNDGLKMEMWMRSTQCFEKINEKWLLTHEQLSVPMDFETKKALWELKPEYVPLLH